MQKLIVVNLDSELDMDHFNKSVRGSIPTSALKPMLFTNLYQKISERHGGNHIRIWGIPRGNKSLLANKWNQINEGDVCVFHSKGNLIGYSRVQIKFQSETIASYLWKHPNEISPKAYLFTLDELLDFSREVSSDSLKLWKKAKFQLTSFDVIQTLKSAEFISSLYFPSDLVPSIDESQAFGLDASSKKAVELYAVSTAIEFLRDKGFSDIQDVGSFHSYDLHASGPEGLLHVEVKGTTGVGEKVILTRNEVLFQKSCFPENALIIVSGIKIDTGSDLRASGGKLAFISPWEIDDSCLVPISFEYTV